MDAKSPEWRYAADKLLLSLARDNKYVVADMLIVFLEASGYGLDNYSAVGGVFKRAAKKGTIRRVNGSRKPALWYSNVYGVKHND